MIEASSARRERPDFQGATIRAGAKVALAFDPGLGSYLPRFAASRLEGFQVSAAPPGLLSGASPGNGEAPALVVAVERDEGGTRPEGSFSVRTSSIDGTAVLGVRGAGVSGAVYGLREALGPLIDRRPDGSIVLGPLDLEESPGLPYRFLWTWDHSTNWYLEQIGLQDIGALNYYLKPKTGFLEDYRRLVDFMSLNRISAVTIYGFLRDNHGGVAAAKELCSYAAERGVRIMPGVGINAYGGVYWEGEHRYNLTNWLRRNPGLRATLGAKAAFHIPDLPELWFPDNQYTDASCPSKPENLAFHEEAIAWLAETFDIGGINFETGDYGTCHCPACEARRRENSSWSFGDMARMYPRLFEAVRKSGKDIHLVVEAYWDTILEPERFAPLASLPDEAIYQFCVNRSYWPRLEAELSPDLVRRLPRSRNILRTHMGSQWNGERYSLVAERFARMASLAARTGMRGMTIFGEASPLDPANEINYLAFARFSWDPSLAWEKFVRRDLGPRFGGEAEALKCLEFLALPDESPFLGRALGEAREIAAGLSGDAYGRWLQLQARLSRKLQKEAPAWRT